MDQSTTAIKSVSIINRLNLLTHALLFVLGFSFVFVIGWGGAATLMGKVFGIYKDIIAKVGGAVVIFFGLVTLGVVKLPWLYYDTRPEWRGPTRVDATLAGNSFQEPFNQA